MFYYVQTVKDQIVHQKIDFLIKSIPLPQMFLLNVCWNLLIRGQKVRISLSAILHYCGDIGYCFAIGKIDKLDY